MACLIVPRQLHFRCPENPFECVHQDTFMLCTFPAPRQWPGSTVSHDARRRIRHAHLSITNHRTINRSLRCAALILINRCTRIPSGRPLALIKRIVGNCLPANLDKATYSRSGFPPYDVLIANGGARWSACIGRITPGRVGNPTGAGRVRFCSTLHPRSGITNRAGQGLGFGGRDGWRHGERKGL